MVVDQGNHPETEPPSAKPSAPAETEAENAPAQVARRRGELTPDIHWHETRRGALPGNHYVRVLRGNERAFQERSTSYLTASDAVYAPRSDVGRVANRIKRVLIGRPIPSAGAHAERLTKVKALAVLSSDALSSVAYATESTLQILVLAGVAAFGLTIPISLVIAALLAIVALSYRQTIFAYPSGGGAYIVARENLGTLPGLIAAASLLIDYILTVSVSVSAGVLAVVSAGMPASYTIPVGVAFILLIMLGNLRGIRESGSIFAVPTYVFIVSLLTLIIVGLVRVLVLHDPAATNGVPREAFQAQENLGIFLILRAFASGCTALTGVEAISNGIPAFQKPESRNAATTLTVMVTLLGLMFLGTSVLAHAYGFVPRMDESLISQMASQVFGGHGVPYFIVQASTCLILVLAANTSYADFPRLGSILARDGFLPRQFQFRGDRLAFTTGIVVLTILSTLLYVVFKGDTSALIPLYAVGVFVSFTLSQAGMVRHWRRTPGNHTRSMIINGMGAVATGIVAVIFAVTKFIYGAWLVIVIIPLLVLLFLAIARHYANWKDQVRLTDPHAGFPQRREQVVIVPVSDLNKVTLNALNYARSVATQVVAVHVTDDETEAAGLQARWETYGEGTNLVILESPYRSLSAPLLSYIDLIQRRRPNDLITVMVPEYVPAHWWEQFLHSQTALRLKAALLFRDNTVVTSVPYHPGRKDTSTR